MPTAGKLTAIATSRVASPDLMRRRGITCEEPAQEADVFVESGRQAPGPATGGISMPRIHTDNQPVTQITIIDAEPEKQREALAVMAKRARFMAKQPGFVSISLHRSLDGRRIVNYIQWESRELLHNAHQSPDFREAWRQFGGVTDQIDPHLYEVAEVLDQPH